MTLRLRRSKLLISAVEPSSVKGPRWKWANRFSKLFHYLEGCTGSSHPPGAGDRMPQSRYATATPQSVCAVFKQLRTPPLASGTLTCCCLPQNVQLAHVMLSGCKDVSRSHSLAIVGHRLPPFSHFLTWKILNDTAKVCTDCARSHIMSGKWCFEVLSSSS